MEPGNALVDPHGKDDFVHGIFAASRADQHLRLPAIRTPSFQERRGAPARSFSSSPEHAAAAAPGRGQFGIHEDDHAVGAGDLHDHLLEFPLQLVLQGDLECVVIVHFSG